MRTSHGHQIPGTPVERTSGAYIEDCGSFEKCELCVSELIFYTLTQRFSPNNEEHIPSPLVKFFPADNTESYRHTKAIFDSYRVLALGIDTVLPGGPEKTTALRKLLESRDAAWRAALDLPEIEKED